MNLHQTFLIDLVSISQDQELPQGSVRPPNRIPIYYWCVTLATDLTPRPNPRDPPFLTPSCADTFPDHLRPTEGDREGFLSIRSRSDGRGRPDVPALFWSSRPPQESTCFVPTLRFT